MNRALFHGLLAGAVLLLTTAIYWQGIGGPFIFDDFPNLAPLGKMGEIDTLAEVVQYLQTGFAGPTGRPVALLSFLVDANTWPAPAEPFKRTNILLHLVTGLLLAWMVRLLVRSLYDRPSRFLLSAVPLICLGWWLLHPLWVSTVLYVVQRMAILAALFSLLAIALYLKARTFLYFSNSRNPVKGYGLLVLAGISSCLAVLSKENAVVLPMLLLIMEVVFFAKGRSGRAAIRSLVLLVFLAGSVYVLFSLFKVGFARWDTVDVRRDFSAAERFWTQGRVLWMYIADLLIPKLSTAGVFHQIEASRGPWSPVTGGLGWLAIVAVLGFSARWASRLPSTFLAVWLFFIAHIIESTVISLELYYEHRNYFPATFLVLILVDVFARFTAWRRRMVLVSVLLLSLNTSILYGRVETWTSYPLMISTWAREAPDSLRANLEVSRVMLDMGDVPAAARFLEKAEKNDPDSVVVDLWRLFLTCRVGRVPEPDQLRKLEVRLSVAAKSGIVMQYLGYIAEGARGACEALRFEEAAGLVRAYRSSPNVAGSRTGARSDIMLGMIHSRQGEGERALNDFITGINRLADANTAMLGVSWLARESHFEEALRLLDFIERGINDGSLREHGFDYMVEVQRLRANVQKEMASEAEK